MGCRLVRRRLPAYANGEIESARVRGWVEQHVAECGACSSELESYSTMKGLLAVIPKEAASEPPSWESVRARIVEREAAQARDRGTLVALRPAFAAAALLVVCGGIWLAFPKQTTVARNDGTTVTPTISTPHASPPVAVANNLNTPDSIVKPGLTEPTARMVAQVHRPRNHSMKMASADTGTSKHVPVDANAKLDGTIAVELSPNTHTGSVDAAVVNKDATSCVIDT